MKKAFLLFLLPLMLFAHAPKVKLFLEKVDDTQVKVLARLGDEGAFLSGLPIKLRSLVSNKTLIKANLQKQGTLFTIPSESYMVIVQSKGKSIEKLGIAPTNGFSKVGKPPLNWPFYLGLVSSLLLFGCALLIGLKRHKISG